MVKPDFNGEMPPYRIETCNDLRGTVTVQNYVISRLSPASSNKRRGYLWWNNLAIYNLTLCFSYKCPVLSYYFHRIVSCKNSVFLFFRGLWIYCWALFLANDKVLLLQYTFIIKNLYFLETSKKTLPVDNVKFYTGSVSRVQCTRSTEASSILIYI